MGARPIVIVKYWKGESHPADSWAGGLHEGIAARANRHHLPLAQFEFREKADREKFFLEPPDAFSGLLFFSIYQKRYRPDVRRAVERFRCPKVILDHHFDDIPMHSVREDAYDGMRQATQHLLELGHRRIAYLDDPDPDKNPWKRAGVIETLRAAGVPDPENCVLPIAAGAQQETIRRLREVLAAPDRPTGIVGVDDSPAFLAVQAADEMALSIPEDLSVVGYGDHIFRGGVYDGLTSVSWDPAHMGEEAVRLLVEKKPEDVPEAVLVPVHLVQRETTGPAPAA